MPVQNFRPKALVVDQKQVVAERIARFLNQHEFDAKPAYSPDEALAIARFWQPDIVLADVSEPGREVVEKALGLCTAVPDCELVLMFNEDADVELIRYYKAQGEDFEMLPTPVDPQELLEFLFGLLRDEAA